MIPAMIGSRPEVGSSKKMSSVGSDGAGETDALLHAPRKLGRVEIGGLGSEADPGELVDREVARGARPRGIGAWPRRKATFCQTVRLSKSAPPWKSMPK